jgi:hypothetical protein
MIRKTVVGLRTVLLDCRTSALALQVWGSVAQPVAQLFRGQNQAHIDQVLTHVTNTGWLRVADELLVRGSVDPRPWEPIAPDSPSGRADLGLCANCETVPLFRPAH